jgi:hypothetical protein
MVGNDSNFRRDAAMQKGCTWNPALKGTSGS